MYGPVIPRSTHTMAGPCFRLRHGSPLGAARRFEIARRPFRFGKTYSTLSNVRVPTMVCPVREKVSGVVLIVRLLPLISK